jgi:hypothetical protein
VKDGDRARITKECEWIATNRGGPFDHTPVPAGATGTLHFGFDYLHHFMDGGEPMECHLDVWHIVFDKYPNRPNYCCIVTLKDGVCDWLEVLD